MTNAAVLIADLIDSRTVRDRKAMERAVRSALARVNADHADALAVPLTLTKGLDEMSAVLARPEDTFAIAAAVNRTLRVALLEEADKASGKPEYRRFRFALAFGRIDIWPDSTRDAGELDGPAFHLAAAGLKRARSEERVFVVELSDLPERSSEDARRGSVTFWPLIEDAADLHQTIAWEWTDTELRVMDRVLSDPEARQADIAAELGMSQQSVSAASRRAHAARIKTTEASIRNGIRLLARYNGWSEDHASKPPE